MFFRSRASLLVAGFLLLAGCVWFLFSWKYADSAKREATTIGIITRVRGGRGSSYEYGFEIDGVKLFDDSSSCRTALTLKGCKVGAPVLVYYDHDPALETMLQEFGAASREEFFSGVWAVFGALLLIVAHFIFRKVLKGPDESDEIDIDRHDEGLEIVHVVPDK